MGRFDVRRSGVVASILAVALGGVWVASVRHDDLAASSGVPAVAADPAAQVPPPSSLRGTVPDGGAHATASDVLLLTPDLIRLFEYYLSTVGERPLADIRLQIERDLDGRLGPNAARQAKDVLARYLAYKERMKTAITPPTTMEAAIAAASAPVAGRLRTAMQTMRATRADFFTAAESIALFGPDDATADAALARVAAEQDPAATPEERRRRLAELDKAAPDAARAREASNLVTQLNDEANAIRLHGGTEDDVYRMRAATVSPEAANRLADLDRDEARWKSRVADYLQQRAALLSGPLPDASVAQLRMQLFTADEQRRLPAYEN